MSVENSKHWDGFYGALIGILIGMTIGGCLEANWGALPDCLDRGWGDTWDDRLVSCEPGRVAPLVSDSLSSPARPAVLEEP